MAIIGGGDEARIVVRLDVEGAKRDFRSLSRAGQRAAGAIGGRGSGGASGGGSGRAATASSGGGRARGGDGGSVAGGFGAGFGAASAARRIPGGAQTMGAARGIGLGAGIGIAAAALFGPQITAFGGAGIRVAAGVAGAAQDVGRAMSTGAAAAAERFYFNDAAARARGSMSALQQTEQAFGYIVGATGDTSGARQFFGAVRRLRETEERGRLAIREEIGGTVGGEFVGEGVRSLLNPLEKLVSLVETGLGRL